MSKPYSVNCYYLECVVCNHGKTDLITAIKKGLNHNYRAIGKEHNREINGSSLGERFLAPFSLSLTFIKCDLKSGKYNITGFI